MHIREDWLQGCNLLRLAIHIMYLNVILYNEVKEMEQIYNKGSRVNFHDIVTLGTRMLRDTVSIF